MDAVITLCTEEVCPVWLHEATRLHWPHPDPAAATGTEDEILASFRSVRNALADRLAVLFEPRALDPSRPGRGTPGDRGEGRA